MLVTASPSSRGLDARLQIDGAFRLRRAYGGQVDACSRKLSELDVERFQIFGRALCQSVLCS